MNELPKKTHRFVWAALITLLLLTLMWLAAELLQAPAKVRRMAGWIFGLALVIGLPARHACCWRVAVVDVRCLDVFRLECRP